MHIQHVESTGDSSMPRDPSDVGFNAGNSSAPRDPSDVSFNAGDSSTPRGPSGVGFDATFDERPEAQIGGGPSPYRLRSNINLTSRAPAETYVAAGLRRVHYPSATTTDVVGQNSDDVRSLRSMCVDEPFELTPSPPPPPQLPAVFTPAIESDVFSAPSQQDVPPLQQPALSTSEAVKEKVFDFLGFGAPGDLPGLPPPPSPGLPPSPSPAFPVKSRLEKDSNPQDADGDEFDDYETFTPSRGRYSNTDLEVLEDAFKRCLDILSTAASEVKRDIKSVVKHFIRLHGYAVGKSEWNSFQCYFAVNVEEVRQLVGLEDGDAKTCWKPFKELPNYKEVLETFSALQSADYSGVTIQQRRRTFEHEVKRIERMAMELTDQHFDMAFVLVGNCVNEDSSLGAVRATPGLEGVFQKRLDVSDDDLLGLMKTHAYNSALEIYTREYIASRDRGRENIKAEPAIDDVSGSDVMGGGDSIDGGDPIDVGRKCTARDANYIRNCIKMHFLNGFKHADAPLVSKSSGGLAGIPTLPWSTMAKALADRGLCIEGWPADVEFPDETKKLVGKQNKSQGLKDLGVPSQRLLLAAFDSGTVTFKKGGDQEALAASKLPTIIGAPPPANSKVSTARRLFADGHHDYGGPPRIKGRATAKRKNQKELRNIKVDARVVPAASKSPTPPRIQSTRKVVVIPDTVGDDDSDYIGSDNDDDDNAIPLPAKRRRLVYSLSLSSGSNQSKTDEEVDESDGNAPRSGHVEKAKEKPVPAKAKGKQVVGRKVPVRLKDGGEDAANKKPQQRDGAASMKAKVAAQTTIPQDVPPLPMRTAQSPPPKPEPTANPMRAARSPLPKPADPTRAARPPLPKPADPMRAARSPLPKPADPVHAARSPPPKPADPAASKSAGTADITKRAMTVAMTLFNRPFGAPPLEKVHASDPVGKLGSSTSGVALKSTDPPLTQTTCQPPPRPIAARQASIPPSRGVSPVVAQPRESSIPPARGVSPVVPLGVPPAVPQPREPSRQPSAPPICPPSPLQARGRTPDASLLAPCLPPALQVHTQSALAPIAEAVGDVEGDAGRLMPAHSQYYDIPPRARGANQEPMVDAKMGDDTLRVGQPVGRWHPPYGDFYGEPYPRRPLPPGGYYTPYPGWHGPNYPEDDGRGGPPVPIWHEQSFPPQPSHPHYYGYAGPRAPPLPSAYGAPRPGPSRYLDPNAARNDPGTGGGEGSG